MRRRPVGEFAVSVKEILENMGLPSTGAPIAPARLTSEDEDAAWRDDKPELQQSLR